MSFPLGLLIKSVFFALRQHRRRETDSAGYYSYTVEGDTKFLVSCPLLLNWWEFQTQTWSHSQFMPQLRSKSHTLIRIGDEELIHGSISAVGN